MSDTPESRLNALLREPGISQSEIIRSELIEDLERENIALRERAAELEAWIAWLEVRIVDVRTPAMWGSHHEFTAQPSDDCAEGEEVGPSNLRDLLRGALARKP